jgi:hypothetical protein
MYSLSKLHLISRSIVSGVVAGTINGCICDFVEFIESNINSDVFVTSIHKSKGREFPRCVVINSADPEMLIKHGSLTHSLSEYSFITDDGDVITHLVPLLLSLMVLFSLLS